MIGIKERYPTEVSMLSTESEHSDLSSTYSSDGEVQHSITRRRLTTGLKYLDINEASMSPREVQHSTTRPQGAAGVNYLDFDESDDSDLSSTYSSDMEVQHSITRPRPIAGVKPLAIDDWERSFVKTAAYQEVRDQLQQHNLVMLTGGPGEGKTTIGHMLCYDYQQQGYITFFSSRWEDLKRDAFEATKPTLVVVDEMGDEIHKEEIDDMGDEIHKEEIDDMGDEIHKEEIDDMGDEIHKEEIDDMGDEIHKEEIDDMGDTSGCLNLVDGIRNKINTNKLVRVVIIYPTCKRDAFNPKMDITQIGRQNWDRTKQEYSQMLQMQRGIPSDTREEIIANLPSYVGFPKVMKHFCQDRSTIDPITFFTYPHSHFRKEIERLLTNDDYSAAIIHILVSGNKVKDNYRYKYESDGSDESDESDYWGYGRDDSDDEFESLFPGVKTCDIPDKLHTLCATYLCQSGNNFRFTEPVIYDACVFVVDNMFPGSLWKRCKVLYETDNKQSLTDLPDKTIFISRHNKDIFLTQLVEDTRRGKFRHTFSHPVLSREDNIDGFVTQLGDGFVDVLHLQDTADSSTDSGSFLYWVLQSGTDYLCQKVLQKQELSQVHVSEGLACCIRLYDTKSFLYLRQQLIGLQRGDITITPDYTDADGNSLLMMSVDRNNAKMVNSLLKDDAESLIKNKVGNSALHSACLRGYTYVAKLLLPHMETWKNLPGQDLRTPVMMAALKGHGRLYEYLADEGKCDLDGVDDNGDTIAHLACQGGSVHIVDHLISRKQFDINQRGQYGKTPLMIAACSGNRDVIELLLSQNWHISPEGFSMSETLSCGHVGDCLNMLLGEASYLLHTAAETGNVELAEFLLSKGKVDIDMRDAIGRTPVMLAAAAGHRHMFEFLTKKQCDLSLKDKMTRGVLHYASEGGNLGIVQDVGCKDVNETDIYNQTPVSYCVKRGHKHIFDTLLNTGGDLSVVDTDKNTLLHLASKGGNQAIVEHLLSSGTFDINAVNRDRRTPLLVAAYSGHTDICQHLIVVGADVHRQDNYGNDVILFAAQTGNLQLAEYVLSVKKRVHFVQDKHGKTAAMWAAERGDADMFTLMSKGCDLSVKNVEENSILHFACTGGNVDIVKSVVSQDKVCYNGRNTFQETPVLRAAYWGHKAVFDLLVSKGCAMTVKDKHGDNILHKACEGGNVEIVEYIVSHNIVDINSTGYASRTPVMMAVSGRHKAVFDLLVSKGCDLTVEDSYGYNILHRACEGGNVQIVEYIVSHNIVDINSTGYGEKTSLDIAEEQDDDEMFDILKQFGAVREVCPCCP
ncbi:uncharacterized protein LOC124122191 [Haliotis rufescens]|uniref:uncharacterized protein LOC124122191 n=1 Tax=Haliotis rufescens TaxID=6454 RepID=UPI00201F24F7|nr:uncharacterized protein LOC124122191 [Haliotis rufescens]